MANCINCGQTLTGKYCANCGQAADTHRYNFKLILKDILEVFYKYKSNLFHSTRLTFSHPVECINNYWEGKRVELYNPFRYVFFISIINSFFMIRFINVTTETVFETDEMVLKWMKIYLNNMTIVDMLEIPIIALFTYLFFRKRKLNYPENLVANCFIFGNIFIVNIAATIVQLIFSASGVAVYSIDISTLFFIIIYPTVIYVSLFNENNFIGVMKSLAALLLAKAVYLSLIVLYTEIF